MSVLRTTGALAASMVLILLTTGAANAGVRPGTGEGAELVKTGWWWAANETPLDETSLAPPQPSPPTIPQGALPVAAANGEPEKFSALEFRLDAEPGALVESARLVLRESGEPGANLNVDGAKILACPVTESFWADGASASWKARPSYDCDLASAAGERDAKSGVWSFDLVAIASLWGAEGHRGSTSVALVEGAEAPESFQVAFEGPSTEGVGYTFTFDEAADPTPLTSPNGPSGEAASGEETSAGSTGSSGGSVGGSSGSFGSTGPSASGTASLGGDAAASGPVDVPAAEAAAAPSATAVTAPVSAPFIAPPWYSGLPTGGLVLLPLALALAYLLMLALGPDAQPVAASGQRGVGRALERLKAAGGSVGGALTSRGRR